MGENAETAMRSADASTDGGAPEEHAAQQPHGQRGGSGAHEDGLDDEDAFVAALLDP